MQLTEQFIKERRYFKNVSRATVVWYEQSFRAFNGALESKADLGQRIADLLNAGTAPISINTYLRCIRAFLKWAHTEGHIQKPYDVPRLKYEEKVLATLSTAQVAGIVSAKPSTPTEHRLHVLALLLLDTGLRIDEALTLTRHDLDFDNLLIK